MNQTKNINWENCPVKGCGKEFLVPEMKYICVQRYRRHGYNIRYHRLSYMGPTYYFLLGTDKQIVKITRDTLVELIRNSQVWISNLTLSSDGYIYFNYEYVEELERRISNFNNFRIQVKNAQEEEKSAQLKNNNPIESYINNCIYKEEIRKGMEFIVTEKNWWIQYPLKNQEESNLCMYYPYGLTINKEFINEHISEIKECYKKISDHIIKSGGKNLKIDLFDYKYNIQYNAEVGKFVLTTYRGQFVVTGESGIKQWLKDIENCVKRVDEIKKRLEFENHKSLAKRMFRAY